MKRILFLLRALVVCLVLFALGKVGFMLYNASIEPFSASDTMKVLWHGISMDASTSGYILAVPWLCCLISIWFEGLPYRKILICYFLVVGILLSIIVAGDAILYEFWKFKLNATIFNYMSNPEGATSSVSKTFMLTRIGAVASTAILFSAFLIQSVPQELGKVIRKIRASLGMVLIGGILFLCIRGGVQESTMNVGVAYFSQRLFLNHSAVNPAFSLLSSISKSQRFDRQFNYFPEEERASLFDGLYPTSTEDVIDTLLRVQRPNVLLVLVESYGGKFIKELGGLDDVSPNWSRLIPQGIFWENYYSNSFRTDRGTVSALSGWVSYPTASLMRLPEKLNSLPSIARSLNQVGYKSDYLYGGDIKIMGKKGYLVGTGYSKLTSDVDFSISEVNESKWGANDSLTAMRTFHMIANRGPEKPWHMGYQTLSSHEPFEVPYHRLKDEKLNAFAYTDHCIGQLIDSLQTLPVWDNLLVVLIPDHGFLYDLTYEDPEFFHSPMLWLGGAIKQPRRMNVLMNQSDLPATLLAQMGLPNNDFPWSRNVLSRNYCYPFAYCTFPSGIMFADSTGVSIFDITGSTAITEQPVPNPLRIQRAKAILQSSYDQLDALH